MSNIVQRGSTTIYVPNRDRAITFTETSTKMGRLKIDFYNLCKDTIFKYFPKVYNVGEVYSVSDIETEFSHHSGIYDAVDVIQGDIGYDATFVRCDMERLEPCKNKPSLIYTWFHCLPGVCPSGYTNTKKFLDMHWEAFRDDEKPLLTDMLLMMRCLEERGWEGIVMDMQQDNFGYRAGDQIVSIDPFWIARRHQ